MILIDYSSILHRMIYASTKDVTVIDGEKIPTENFIEFTMHLVLHELYSIEQQYSREYGEMVICLDKSNNGYWRTDVYKYYKQSRKESREISPYNWNEIYKFSNIMLECIENNLPWKVVCVDRAEADDLMLVLSRYFNEREKILIHCPDKDLIQAQIGAPNVKQYSALTKKWVVPEHKSTDMNKWIMEHVCLGDESDGVPRIFDFTEFTDSFKEYLISKNVNALEPVQFFEYSKDFQTKLFDGYNIYKTNKKGEDTEKDIFVKPRFGPTDLEKILNGKYQLNEKKKKLTELKTLYKDDKESIKKINQKIKSLEIDDKTPEERFEEWLDSHPLYRKNYNRNFTLVMEQGIPADIWNNVILQYKSAKNEYNHYEFHKFLSEYNLTSLKLIMNFESNSEICAADFGW